MMRIFRYVFFLGIVFYLFFVTGCFSDTEKKEIEVPVSEESAAKLWAPSEKKVCVVFGPGYTEPEFTGKALEMLSEQFGLEADGGLIRPLYYPDDFLYFGIVRISRLSELASDAAVTAVITIGGPEGTALGLSLLRAQRSDIRIISAFPQDDPVAIEGTSAIVIDFDRGGDDLIAEEQALNDLDAVPDLLRSMADIAIAGDIPVMGEPLRVFAADLFDPWTVQFYIDPETGMRSGNHFILARKQESS
ncbi:MAG: DUF3798 domain-containing protein [Spirochaetaceae bacterium]|jgi:hypothetical protein|nr:DUF3798 domain-containing protein [Spirochaetaceae bacterium]